MPAIRILALFGLLGLISASFTLAPIALPANAQAQPPRTLLARPPVVRTVELPELGFREGATLQGLGAGQEFYFPVPRDGTGTRMGLRLAYEVAASFEGRRVLQVQVGERPVFTRPLSGRSERNLVEIPIEGVDTRLGFIRIVVRYTGALTENRCTDDRLSGEALTILPDTGLRLQIPPERLADVASVWSLMPRTVVIGVPDRMLNPSEASAALVTARAVRRGGGEAIFASPGEAAQASDGHWTRGSVAIVQPTDMTGGTVRMVSTSPNQAGPTIVWSGGVPGIQLGATAPERDALLLDQLRSPGRTTPSHSAPHALQQSEMRIPFSRLASLQGTEIVERGVWSIPLSATDVPEGTIPSAIETELSVASDAGTLPSIVSIYFNEQLLGSQPAGQGEPTRVRVAVPPSLFQTTNSIRIVVARQARGGHCTQNVVPLPAHILPTSAVQLTNHRRAPAEFYAIAQKAAGGADVFIGANGVRGQRAALEALASAASSVTGAAAPLPVSFGQPRSPVERVFLYAGDAARPPAGLLGAPQFDGGGPVASDNLARVLQMIGEEHLSVAQVVENNSGPLGIWIKPLTQPTGFAQVTGEFDRGNIAVISSRGKSISQVLEPATVWGRVPAR